MEDTKISQELRENGLRIASYDEAGWYWRTSNSDGEPVTLWVTDEPEKEE